MLAASFGEKRVSIHVHLCSALCSLHHTSHVRIGYFLSLIHEHPFPSSLVCLGRSILLSFHLARHFKHSSRIIMRQTLLLTLAFGFCGVSALPQPESVNIGRSPASDKGPGNGDQNAQRAQAVVEAFRFAWNGYQQLCFGQDELHPASNTCGNSR
jgi:hypothetical protein